jgi:hypothetical protein
VVWPSPRIHVGVAAVALSALAWAAPSAPAGFSEGFAETDVSVTGPVGPVPKGQIATYTGAVTNQGDGPESEGSLLYLNSYRVNGDRPVPNPFQSVESTRGGCEIRRTSSSFGDYHSATCSIANLAPGESLQVTARIEINESMDLYGSSDTLSSNTPDVTTLVDAPPEVSGSKKIKLRGLPPSCASKDFTLKASAKRAKKITAALIGPLNAEGKPPAGESSKSKHLASANGAKLKAPVDVGKLGPAYYEIKLAAKYQDRPKQKASVLFQRC